MGTFYTIGQVAREFNAPEWRIRRIVDSLAADIPRAGLYRLVPADLLAEIASRLNIEPATAEASR